MHIYRGDHSFGTGHKRKNPKDRIPGNSNKKFRGRMRKRNLEKPQKMTRELRLKPKVDNTTKSKNEISRRMFRR